MTELDADMAEHVETVDEPDSVRNRRGVGHAIAYLVLPVAVLVMALGVGYLKWRENSVTVPQAVAAQSVSAATEATTAMLSYRADYVDQDLIAASERMTGDFRNEYTTLINEVVIPGAKEQRISAVATVPAAALVSASGNRADVLVYINQTTTVGEGPPTDTTSSARVAVEKVDNHWLLAGFEPI
jgi:Mce-associated membrane protein